MCLARVEQPLADQSLFGLGEGGALGGERQLLFDVAGGARILFGQRLQRRHAGGDAGGLQPGGARAAFAQLFLFGAGPPGRDLVDGQQRVGVDVGRAGAPAVLEEPAPHHGQRRGDAIEVQVIAFAGRQRLAVTVAAVGREAAVDRAVRVLQRGPLRARLIGQHAWHPAVGEVDDGQTARAGRGRVDDPFRTADNLDRALLQRQVRNGRQRVGIVGRQRRAPHCHRREQGRRRTTIRSNCPTAEFVRTIRAMKRTLLATLGALVLVAVASQSAQRDRGRLHAQVRSGRRHRRSHRPVGEAVGRPDRTRSTSAWVFGAGIDCNPARKTGSYKISVSRPRPSPPAPWRVCH